MAAIVVALGVFSRLHGIRAFSRSNCADCRCGKLYGD